MVVDMIKISLGKKNLQKDRSVQNGRTVRFEYPVLDTSPETMVSMGSRSSSHWEIIIGTVRDLAKMDQFWSV
ncbi:unnamed protein product [Rhizophagus irregularis]|nr:unnamed protein product [Rhizophagus irregularis]